MLISSSQAIATEAPQPVTCKDVIKAANTAIKAKQDALDKANQAIKQQTEVVETTSKELDSVRNKLNSPSHNTYVVGALGTTSGVLLATGLVIPGAGVIFGIIILGIFQ